MAPHNVAQQEAAQHNAMNNNNFGNFQRYSAPSTFNNFGEMQSLTAQHNTMPLGAPIGASPLGTAYGGITPFGSPFGNAPFGAIPGMGNIPNMQGSGFSYQGMNNLALQQNHALIMQQQQQLLHQQQQLASMENLYKSHYPAPPLGESGLAQAVPAQPTQVVAQPVTTLPVPDSDTANTVQKKVIYSLHQLLRKYLWKLLNPHKLAT